MVKETTNLFFLALVVGIGLFTSSSSFGYYDMNVRPKLNEKGLEVKVPSIVPLSFQLERNPGYGRLGKPVAPEDDRVIKSAPLIPLSVQSESDSDFGRFGMPVVPDDGRVIRSLPIGTSPVRFERNVDDGIKLVVLPVDDVQI